MPNSLLQIAAVSLAAIIVPQAENLPAAWVVEEVSLPEPVEAVVQTPEGVFVQAGEWFLLFPCDDALLCAEPGEPVFPQVPEDGIPGGFIATAESGQGVRQAWYSEPTDRYPHGALGDVIEGGALVAEDEFGQRYELRLDASQVFEDLTPRVVDIDGDGRNEVVTIRSSTRSGAAVAVYGIYGGRLIEQGATPPIGRANRWLNIAGLADFVGGGHPNVAIVKTPHIGGTLEILRWNRNKLEVVDTADDFSNHAFGSIDQGLSAVASVDGDRIPDLILPNAARDELRMVTAAGGTIREIVALPLPAQVETTIGVVSAAGPLLLATGLSDGTLVAITKQE